MRIQIKTFFHTFGNETPTDLLAHLLTLVPEDVEVTNHRAEPTAGNWIHVFVTVSCSKTVAHEIATSFARATGLPSRDVVVRGTYIQ